MVQSEAGNPTEIDYVWQKFIHEKVNSFIKWDLVRFFHDNPHTVDTAENISYYIGHSVETLEDELQGLVDSDVLSVEFISGMHVYRLVDDPEMQELISDFVAACHDRSFRVQAINHVIAGMNLPSDHNT